MYFCMVIYVRATAYSLDCHVGAMINRRLYRTYQSLVVHRTAAVTSTGRELSVAMSSIELGQSTLAIVLSPAVTDDEAFFHCRTQMTSAGECSNRNTQFAQVDGCCLM